MIKENNADSVRLVLKLERPSQFGVGTKCLRAAAIDFIALKLKKKHKDLPLVRTRNKKQNCTRTIGTFYLVTPQFDLKHPSHQRP